MHFQSLSQQVDSQWIPSIALSQETQKDRGGLLYWTRISISLADITIQKYADKNRSLKFLKTINNTIDWEPVDELLIRFYKPGKSNKGERAYSPLFLFKCMLLQKWFQIKSDSELESQIYDRISFKFFLDMPFDSPSPDHSTFSRFRKRIPKDAMVQINSALLKQFHRDGLTINKGVAVDIN